MLSVLTKDGYMPIENRQSYYIEMNYDGFSQLSFDVSNNDPMSKYLINEAVIKNEDNRFLIKDVNRRTQNTTYTCEIDLDEWKENIFFDTANDVRFQTKSLGEVLDVIKPNDWKIINASIRSIKRTPELKDATSHDILKSLEEIYSIVFEIRVLSKEIYIIDPEQFEYDGLYATPELNMKKVTWQGSSKDFCTRLYAYGKVDEDGNTINITSVNDGKEYIDDNTYTDKIVTLVWRDERYIEPQSLYDDARNKLDQLCVPKMSYDISIYDLSQMNKEYDFLQFGLYKQVKTFINDELSILQKVVTYKKYYDKPDKNVITLSNEQQKFTSKVSNALGGSSNQIINGSILEQAQKESAQIINEFATKGHRYETENETYFLDKLPKEAAKFVMRQNLGGIAFSQSGWAGPYTTAWTIDGKFNASFITTGVLKAIRIEGGSGDFSGKIIATSGNIGGFDLDLSRMSSFSTKAFNYVEADMERIKDIILGRIEPTEEDYKRLDVNGNGKMDAVDFYIISKIFSTGNVVNTNFSIYPTFESGSNFSCPVFEVEVKGFGKTSISQTGSLYSMVGTIDNLYSDYISCDGDLDARGTSHLRLIKLETAGGDSKCVIKSDYYNNSTNLYIECNEYDGYIALSVREGAEKLYLEPSNESAYSAFFGPMNNGRCTLGKSSNRFYRLYSRYGEDATSDRRQKKDFVEFDERYIKLVEMLIPMFYRFNEQTEEQSLQSGFIAQDILSAMKECGIDKKEFGAIKHSEWIDKETGEEKDEYSLVYSMFIPLLTYYIQFKNKDYENRLSRIEKTLYEKGMIE